MLQNTADEIQGLIAEICVFITCEERLAVFPDRHVAMHAGSVITGDGFRHECG